MEDRLHQAFLRGYARAMAGNGSQANVHVATLVRTATIESRHLHSSIDACEEAIAQLGSLPPAEDVRLHAEARASLETLGETVDRLLLQLQACRQGIHNDDDSSAEEGLTGRSGADAGAASSSAGKAAARKAAAKKSSSKKSSAKKSQSKKRSGK